MEASFGLTIDHTCAIIPVFELLACSVLLRHLEILLHFLSLSQLACPQAVINFFEGHGLKLLISVGPGCRTTLISTAVSALYASDCCAAAEPTLPIAVLWEAPDCTKLCYASSAPIGKLAELPRACFWFCLLILCTRILVLVV